MKHLTFFKQFSPVRIGFAGAHYSVHQFCSRDSVVPVDFFLE
jgi:hypothetical protein